jgi:hypothetical protein
MMLVIVGKEGEHRILIDTFASKTFDTSQSFPQSAACCRRRVRIRRFCHVVSNSSFLAWSLLRAINPGSDG